MAKDSPAASMGYMANQHCRLSSFPWANTAECQQQYSLSVCGARPRGLMASTIWPSCRLEGMNMLGRWGQQWRNGDSGRKQSPPAESDNANCDGRAVSSAKYVSRRPPMLSLVPPAAPSVEWAAGALLQGLRHAGRQTGMCTGRPYTQRRPAHARGPRVGREEVLLRGHKPVAAPSQGRCRRPGLGVSLASPIV